MKLKGMLGNKPNRTLGIPKLPLYLKCHPTLNLLATHPPVSYQPPLLIFNPPTSLPSVVLQHLQLPHPPPRIKVSFLQLAGTGPPKVRLGSSSNSNRSKDPGRSYLSGLHPKGMSLPMIPSTQCLDAVTQQVLSLLVKLTTMLILPAVDPTLSHFLRLSITALSDLLLTAMKLCQTSLSALVPQPLLPQMVLL